MVPRDWWWNELRITKSEGTRSLHCAGLLIWPTGPARPSTLYPRICIAPLPGNWFIRKTRRGTKNVILHYFDLLRSCHLHRDNIGETRGRRLSTAPSYPGLPAVFIFPIEHWTLTLSLKPINKSQYTLKIKLWNDGRRSLVGSNIYNGR